MLAGQKLEHFVTESQKWHRIGLAKFCSLKQFPRSNFHTTEGIALGVKTSRWGISESHFAR